MTQTSVLCSCCRKDQLVSIPYQNSDGSESQVEVCPRCDETKSWPNQKGVK